MSELALDDQMSGDRLAKRNALVLACAQAIGGANAPIAISMGGLSGLYLLDTDKSLATLPVTCFVLGTALTTIPAAAIAKRFGRQPAYLFGALVSMGAGALAAYSLFQSNFLLFCIGLLVSGATNAFAQQYRFAAADTASDPLKPKVISWVLAGGVVTGVVGPQAAIHTKDVFLPVPYAGAFIAQIGLAAVAMLILTFLHAPKISSHEIAGTSRPLARIVAQPRFIVSVICAIGSYALMSLVMTAAPIAMAACGHSPTDSTWGIQWHVIAMFAPSFFTGHLISRFGAERVVAVGLVLLGLCAVIALSGIDVAHFWAALILLGVGWNFGFIGATSMVTSTYAPAERAKVQAINDFLVFGFVAAASLSSGILQNAFGWDVVNYTVFPVIVLCFAMLGWLKLSKRGTGVA